MTLPVLSKTTEDGPQLDLVDELSRLHRQLQSHLDGWKALPSLLGGAFTPVADVEETEDAYLVEIELPGVRREDIDVEVSADRLTVTGERTERERIGILRHRTRTVGRFHYEVTLPGHPDNEGVTAALAEGVLTVRVPKPEHERPRRIPVT